MVLWHHAPLKKARKKPVSALSQWNSPYYNLLKVLTSIAADEVDKLIEAECSNKLIVPHCATGMGLG